MKNHRRNFDAATPIRFTTTSCKTQCYYARSRSSKKHVCSHPTASAKTELQSTIDLRTPNGNRNCCSEREKGPLQCRFVTKDSRATAMCRMLRGESFPSEPASATQVPCNMFAAIALQSPLQSGKPERTCAHLYSYVCAVLFVLFYVRVLFCYVLSCLCCYDHCIDTYAMQCIVIFVL